MCNVDDLVGAIQHPEDGYIQPADLTQALATGARNRGAEIYRKELSSCSTWHAAGLLPLFNMSYSVGHLHKYAVDFYKTL